MSAFKSSIDVEYSVYSVLDPVVTKKKGKKAVSHARDATPAAAQDRIARAAPGLRPPEPRPISAGVLATGGRGKSKGDTGSKAKGINLAVANKRGADLASGNAAPVAAPVRAPAPAPVPRQAVALVRKPASEPALSTYGSGNTSGGGSQEFGAAQVAAPCLPLPRRSEPAPSRRPIPAGRRFQLEQQKLEAAAVTGSWPVHPVWNIDCRAPDRELLMLEQDDTIHKLKYGDGMPLSPIGSANATSADGGSHDTEQRNMGSSPGVREGESTAGAGDDENNKGKGSNGGLISSRTPRDVTPADIYAPHRIRSTKFASGPVVNGRDKGLFHIAKLAATKAAEPNLARKKTPEKRGPSPTRGNSAAAAPVPASGRARHKQHVDHDNIRNHVIHGNDAHQGHMGIHISEEDQHPDMTKRPHGIHSSPWNFSELLLDVMLAEERLLPAPVNRMVPMFDRKASSAAGAAAGAALPNGANAGKTPDSARSTGSAPRTANDSGSAANVTSSACTGHHYKHDIIHKEKSLSKIPDIANPLMPSKVSARRAQ